MYAKSTRPSAKREVQKDRSAKRDDQIARPRRAQACERRELRAKRAMRMCPRSGQIFSAINWQSGGDKLHPRSGSTGASSGLVVAPTTVLHIRQ